MVVVFFGALLWGSMIQSWNWEKYSCHSKLVSTLSMLLLSVLSWRVSQAWNPHQQQLSPGTWSLWLSQASVHSLWSLCWCHWCHQLGLLSTDLHAVGCGGVVKTLNYICQFFFLSCYQCHQESGGWWLFCLQCRQCLRDLLRRMSRSFLEIIMLNLKMVGESRYPCRILTLVRNQSSTLLLKYLHLRSTSRVSTESFPTSIREIWFHFRSESTSRDADQVCGSSRHPKRTYKSRSRD